MSQHIIVSPPSQQRLIVNPTEATVLVVKTKTNHVSVIGSGQPGPPGLPGEPGPPGISSEESLMLHAMDPTPHSAYDDIPSLSLIFENGIS